MVHPTPTIEPNGTSETPDESSGDRATVDAGVRRTSPERDIPRSWSRESTVSQEATEGAYDVSQRNRDTAGVCDECRECQRSEQRFESADVAGLAEKQPADGQRDHATRSCPAASVSSAESTANPDGAGHPQSIQGFRTTDL